ncbi:MAG: HipA protein [Lachnospiraceae bacterium]|nr:HipA protein [Lachnospiraceae bacterium]
MSLAHLNAFDGSDKGSMERTKYYVLMNKDVKVADFHVDTVFDEITIDKVHVELPDWINNLKNMISNRRAPKHRENIAQLLKESGCDTIAGFLDIAHALSLIDTFWVKSADSKLQWNNVSLYTHPFDETIAKTAFEGGLHGRQLSNTSPEYGTDGSFAKCWIREDGQIRLLKRGSSGARNAGLEPYSEYYACQLIREFTDHYVNYDLRSRSGRICSVCDIFTSEEYGFLPYAAMDSGNSDFLDVVKRVEKLTGSDSEIRTMFIVDAVILNEDRHKNNFGFIVDNAKQKIVDFAPLFDYNVSLLPYAEEDDFANAEEYMKSKGPRLSDSWIKSAARCMTPEAKKTLIRLKGFEFSEHAKYNLPQWRLHALEKIINYNIDEILKLSNLL